MDSNTDALTAIVADALRRAALDENLDARRAFHGRGQTYPGLENLSVDLFEPLIVVSFFAALSDEFVESLVEKLEALLGDDGVSQRYNSLLIQHRYRKPCEMEVIRGSLPEHPVAVERGHTFEISLDGNQNIGFFLDAEPARRWIQDNSADAKVLNLFAYTCALSVAAIAGNAKRVVNIDMSRNALRVGERNHRLNFSEQELENNRVKFMPYEIFRSVSRLAKNGPFDLIVIDPPSFQPGSFVAKTDYAKLVRKLPRLLRRGGKVLAMLNAPNLSPEFLGSVFEENFPELAYVSRLENSADFPDANPDRSLKMMVYECTRR